MSAQNCAKLEENKFLPFSEGQLSHSKYEKRSATIFVNPTKARKFRYLSNDFLKLKFLASEHANLYKLAQTRF